MLRVEAVRWPRALKAVEGEPEQEPEQTVPGGVVAGASLWSYTTLVSATTAFGAGCWLVDVPAPSMADSANRQALYRLSVSDASQGYSLQVYASGAAEQITLADGKGADVAKLWTETLQPSVQVKDVEGSTPLLAADTITQWAKASFTITDDGAANVVWASLQLADAALAGLTWLELTNHDSGHSTRMTWLDTVPLALAPNADGYTLSVHSVCPADVARPPVGPYRLRVYSLAPLASFATPDASASVVVSEFSDAYRKNTHHVVCREHLSSAAADASSVAIEVSLPGAGLHVTLSDAESGTVVLRAAALDAVYLPAVWFKPGRSLLLDCRCDPLCALPQDAANGDAGSQWRLRTQGSAAVSLAPCAVFATELAAAKTSWESAAPGRNAKGKESREKFRTRTEPLPAPLTHVATDQEEVLQTEETLAARQAVLQVQVEAATAAAEAAEQRRASELAHRLTALTAQLTLVVDGNTAALTRRTAEVEARTTDLARYGPVDAAITQLRAVLWIPAAERTVEMTQEALDGLLATATEAGIDLYHGRADTLVSAAKAWLAEQAKAAELAAAQAAAAAEAAAAEAAAAEEAAKAAGGEGEAPAESTPA